MQPYDVRFIAIRSHLSKILEKAIFEKIQRESPHLLMTKFYQAGFKEGQSTVQNVSFLLNSLHGKTNCKKKGFGLLVDLTKAFDCVKRDLLFDILWKRAHNDFERYLVQLIYALYRRSVLKIGDETIEANLGVP